MKRAILSLMAGAALPLAACTTTEDDTLASAGTGAAIGAAGGAGVAAIAGGDLLTGAVIGAAVGGLAGAVWADRNNDGQADGYVYNGQYYEGAPGGTYQNASATRCGPSVGRSAATGAAVGGIAGAIWADANNDGCADGYVREGQYYSGSPVVQPTNLAYTGERG